jgi:hypothetical protein
VGLLIKIKKLCLLLVSLFPTLSLFLSLSLFLFFILSLILKAYLSFIGLLLSVSFCLPVQSGNPIGTVPKGMAK